MSSVQARASASQSMDPIPPELKSQINDDALKNVNPMKWTSSECNLLTPTKNSRLFQEEYTMASRHRDHHHYCVCIASSPSKNKSRPSTSSSSESKQYTSSSSSAPQSAQSHGCEQTFAETVASSWSQSSYLGEMNSPYHERHTHQQLAWTATRPLLNPFYFFQNCLVCFWWPTMHVIEDQPCNDCFVEIDCSDRLMESEYCRNPNPSVYGSYDFPKQTSSPQHYQTPKDRKEDSATLFSPLTEKIIFKSKPPFFKLCQEHEGNGDFIQSKIMTLKKENSQFSPSKLARLTPITVDSKASITDTTKNGETFSSLNTLHRRTNLFSLGFFTTETLDMINSSTSDINCGTCTPRTHQDNDSNVFKFDDIHRHRFLAYETPDEPRAVDYGSFRKAIKEVTCQKKTTIDDVSPIGSEDGFSACFNGSGAIGVSTTPRLSIAKASDHKSQHCDVASVLRQVNQVDLLNGTKGESNPNVIPGLNLFGEFRAEESNRDSGSNKYLVPKFEKGKTKSEQSFIHGTSEGEAAHAQITDTSDEKENGLKKRSSLTNASPAAASGRQKGSSSPNCNRAQSKQDEFLRKSSSFLKVLRKTGRKGKCLIQGWVAFRQSVPWDEIARNPKRCDFRYIVLLDDKPILHIFTSRSKTKKGLPNQQQQEEELLSPDELDGCISLDLTEDIAMEMKFVSKELGNAMCIRDTETGQLLCNMLPISMPSNAFLDKHQSRLVKRDKLKCIFSRTTSQQAKQSQQDKSSNAKQDKDMLSPLSKSSKWGDPGFIDRMYTPIEQYDVSRHLLFVLDAAIKFPPPRS